MNSPAHEQWFSNDAWTRHHAQQAGEELVARLEAYAAHIGQPFTDFQSYVLRHSAFDFAETLEKYEETHSKHDTDVLDQAYRYHVVATIDKAVAIARLAIEAEKRMGAPRAKVRPGLWIPVWWRDRCEKIFQTGLAWMISPIMRSALAEEPDDYTAPPPHKIGASVMGMVLAIAGYLTTGLWASLIGPVGLGISIHAIVAARRAKPRRGWVAGLTMGIIGTVAGAAALLLLLAMLFGYYD